ncbi:GATA zinc finger domain-containing protein 10 [Apiospora kogelbergensis]|uniref:GATA zinc finger domain-containing protein 10 n=1 Tax=Apiospora kogelbergensis TaxID=1337665 RepID=UPI0031316CB3
MATATLLSPAGAYHPHNSAYAHPPPPPTMPGMMSAGESRRTPSELEASKRQSLPSISEVFSSSKPSHYSPTTQSTHGSSQGLPPPPPPPPFSAAPPRTDAGPEARATLATPEERFSRFAPRSEGPYPGPSSSSFAFGEQREGAKALGPITTERESPTGFVIFTSKPSPARTISPWPPSPSDLPATHGASRRYDSSALNRHFEAWGYTDCLQRISWTARTMSNFAEAYLNIASEQHGGQPIPERLPTSREITEMLSNVDYMRKSLENVREIQHNVETEKAREAGKHQRPYDDDDVSMYGDGLKQHYGIGEVKKRRGRAAPPGRCHSCNRIDTPEWRRGPDGARTLCNACGLHYAKLERKRQMEQRAIRPKASSEN